MSSKLAEQLFLHSGLYMSDASRCRTFPRYKYRPLHKLPDHKASTIKSSREIWQTVWQTTMLGDWVPPKDLMTSTAKAFHVAEQSPWLNPRYGNKRKNTDATSNPVLYRWSMWKSTVSPLDRLLNPSVNVVNTWPVGTCHILDPKNAASPDPWEMATVTDIHSQALVRMKMCSNDMQKPSVT